MIEACIAHDEWDLIGTGGQAKRGFLGIVDDERSSQTQADLLPGQLVRMRVVPVQAGALVDRILVRGSAGSDRIEWTAVCNSGHNHSVPVHGTLLRQSIDEVNV